MIYDPDNYILKCVLENLSQAKKREDVEELCACSLGLKTTDNNKENEDDRNRTKISAI